jgi:nucleotide-binding universal stress UspA family protein
MAAAHAEALTLSPPHLKLKNILLLVDFSAQTHAVLAQALRIQQERGSMLHLCHLLPPLARTFVPMDALPDEFDPELVAARGQLNELVEKSRMVDVPYKFIIQRGKVGEIVPELIEDFNVDLLVMGTHGHPGLRKLIFGSDVEGLFRHVHCPVLVIGPKVSERLEEQPFQRILLATDFEPGSKAAVIYSMSLAKDHDAKLLLLHVVRGLGEMLPDARKRLAEVREHLRTMLPHDAPLFCSPDVTIDYGQTTECIINTATEEKADLIVMGLRADYTPSGAAHTLHDTAYDVASLAPAPVLFIPATEAPGAFGLIG